MASRTLLLDIETAPNIAYAWRLYDDYISPDQLVANSHVLCVSAKWLGEKDVLFYSLPKHGRAAMLKAVSELMCEADVIIHYNGTKFDIPNLNLEFLVEGMPPPSPVKQVDLLRVVKKQFKFSSNKLDFVCQRLGLGNKVSHKGMGLWKGCMANDPASWKVMERYNKQDVVLLERLYHKLIPWVPNHPNHTLYSNSPNECPRCGSTKFQSRGTYYSASVAYKRYQCSKCHGWFKGGREPRKVDHAPVN